MEMELEPRVKPLGYKVKGMSRESPAQKGSHVLDSDLRSYWSSGTNTKEWILLELDEPCLLSHIRIYNKSVLEWEISVGLRYKPETFVKVRPRCEAPRRDIMYPMNYTPCRYVRISCLRGNPIAIFFVQLIGVPVSGLEAEFQPVVNHLLPDIISHKQDSSNMHLQLLQEITNRLLVFVPQLEADLASFTDAPEQSIRFLAMLAGPFYPILHVVKERESARTSSNISDAEVSRSSQSSSLITVSSNFEPRRPRGMFHVLSTTSSSLVFRPDAVFAMLRKAYKDSDLGTVCKMASRILHKLVEPVTVLKASQSGDDVSSALDDMAKSDLHPLLVDYSSLFGEEFQMPNDEWDSSLFNLLDIGAVEEGILHVLFACASQPLFCCKLVENASEFWSALPLVQALLPALRPSVNNLSDSIDDSFSLWKQSLVQQALSEIVSTSCSALYRPLLHACAGYLASYSSSHVKAACILLDLCSSVLAPWMSQVVAKVDLAVELLEDLLGAIQGANRCLVRARAALKYIILAVSGHMDDVLGKYKEVKHKILFLLEMLEPFLDPAIYAWKSSIAFGDVSFSFLEKQEQSCMTALNIIRIAVEKPAVLPALETEWRRGLVPPSVLLSILEPHMQLPPEIDMCKSSMNKDLKHEASGAPHSSVLGYGGASSKTNSQDEMDGKVDISDSTAKTEICEDASLLFAPHELRNMAPTSISAGSNENVLETDHKASNSEVRHLIEKKLNHLFNNGIVLDVGFAAEFFNSQVDYYQLINYHDCELRASDFRRLAVDLQMQNEIVDEAHHTAVDALLLAAECYVNPFFLMPFRINSKLDNAVSISRNRNAKFGENFELRSAFKKTGCDIETISILEKKRDKIVLELLLEAANLDKKFHTRTSDGGLHEGIEKQVLKLFPDDIPCADAVTLLRQNQASLCTFLIERLKKDQQSMHEILLHCLVFLLHSATQLYCSPEEVIDIILQSAEDLNTLLTSFYSQSKEESIRLDPEKVHWIQRRWMLLQRMVVASSGNEGSDFSVNIKNGYRCGKLIPPSAWIQRIPTFSCSTYPLVRFIGWMAVSRNAQQYTKEGLALASDLSQLTCLLSIYRDDLTAVENIINKKYVVQKKEFSEVKQDLPVGEVLEPANHQLGDQSFHVLYPDLCKFFPNMKRQFESFGEDILVAVGLQLRSLSSTLVPDILCWLSDLCSWPFLQGCKIASQNCSRYLKGYVSKNAKAIILYILEAIVVEHMEAMVPEIPRVVQVLISLCRSPYFDVSFLDSVMHLLKPIILHALHKVSDEEINMVEESCLNFESLCFDELFVVIRQQNDGDKSSEHDYNQAMLIFILACVFTDLSFRNKRDILQSLASWANFTNFEPSASFRDYLLAFQAILESCKVLLVQSLKSVDAIPLQMPYTADADTVSLSSNMPEAESWFLNDVCSSSTPLGSDKPGNDKCDVIDSKKKDYCLTLDDIEGFSADLENLISKLILNIERSWNLHYSLARNLTIVSAECSMYMKCLSKTMSQHQIADEGSCENSEHKPNTQFLVHWKVALAWLAQTVVELQNSHCWDVAAVMLDCLLGVPRCFLLDNVVDTICSAIKHSCYSAPKMPWRLRSDKWLSILLVRVAHDLQEGHTFLSNLFVALLDHYEPEQRFIALQHLGRLVGYDINGESAFEPSKYCNKLVSPKAVAEQFLSHLVSSTWDKVILLASSDALLSLRTRALALLIGYIPYAEAHQLQTFLSAADTVLPVLGKILYPACEGPMLRLSLALVLGACLYSPAEDVSLMPQDVWRNIETIGLSRTGGHFGDLEKNACKVLCRLRDEGEEAKEPLKEVLASGFPKQPDLKFISTRETVLQVLSDLTSVDSYFDMFSKKIEENEMELEEAEIELEILQKENATEEFSKGIEQEIPLAIASVKGDNRLQQIKEQINSIEKAKLQQDILARRQKKLFMRHARRKYLEEAALREEELLRELDREKTAEAEKEIERHKLLELERAKTRELRHNLDMEKERQTQRDLQRELEQVAETGLRSSRRDFSTSTARSRDRYRERENGRSSNEGIARTGSASLPPEISATSAPLTVPTVVLSGSRSFSGQPPTILQSRDRSDEGGSSYEENFDGSKDSGDTGSVGEPDLISAFDTQSGGYGSAQRHGSRGSRSRQVMERRERDGRREGKWERKHS